MVNRSNVQPGYNLTSNSEEEKNMLLHLCVDLENAWVDVRLTCGTRTPCMPVSCGQWHFADTMQPLEKDPSEIKGALTSPNQREAKQRLK